MIQYNPKDWFTFIFMFHKADTFRKLIPMLLGLSIYSAIIVFAETQLKLTNENQVKFIPQMHALLGFAISMLLVFRTNTAYDRWWEARKLWGLLVNNSRNLAIKLSVMLPVLDYTNRIVLSKAIGLFAFALHHHLRKEKIQFGLIDTEDKEGAFTHIDHNKHVPNQLATLIFKQVNQIHRENKITGEQFLSMNTEMNSFMDICGGCERIKNTPIPFSYSVFIKKFIFFYIMTLPFGFGHNLGYYTVPLVVFIFFVLASLELIAEEIEDPFSGDENDVPTQRLSENIWKNVQEVLLTN